MIKAYVVRDMADQYFLAGMSAVTRVSFARQIRQIKIILKSNTKTKKSESWLEIYVRIGGRL